MKKRTPLIQPRIIAVIGTRRRNTDKAMQKVVTAVRRLHRPGDWLVSGGCKKGADRIAWPLARSLGCALLVHFPNYRAFGRGAPLVRNTLVAHVATHMVACVAKDRTGGTEDTIKKFLKRNDKKRLVLV